MFLQVPDSSHTLVAKGLSCALRTGLALSHSRANSIVSNLLESSLELSSLLESALCWFEDFIRTGWRTRQLDEHANEDAVVE